LKSLVFDSSAPIFFGSVPNQPYFAEGVATGGCGITGGIESPPAAPHAGASAPRIDATDPCVGIEISIETKSAEKSMSQRFLGITLGNLLYLMVLTGSTLDAVCSRMPRVLQRHEVPWNRAQSPLRPPHPLKSKPLQRSAWFLIASSSWTGKVQIHRPAPTASPPWRRAVCQCHSLVSCVIRPPAGRPLAGRPLAGRPPASWPTH